MIGIVLIAGFMMGCGCTVALLFFLKRATRAPNLSVYTNEGREVRSAPAEQADAADPEDAFQKQWEAMMAYDGTKQKREDVTDDGD